MAKKAIRARSKFNRINPLIIFLSFMLNLWTLLIYCIFPYTPILNTQTFKFDSQGMMAHYILFGTYFVLFTMSLWSFMVASFSNPGYIPRHYREYDRTKLS